MPKIGIHMFYAAEGCKEYSMAVFYDIVPLALTTTTDDDYSAKVKTQSATLEDVANAVIDDGNEYTKETLLAVYSHMEGAIRDMVTAGYTVTTDNIVYMPTIKGKFTKSGTWDSDENSFACALNPAQTFRSTLANVTPSFTGYVNSNGGMQIESTLDVTTSDTNGNLTIGGAVIVYGKRLKVAGDGSGVWFSKAADDGSYDTSAATTEITLLAINMPSKLMFTLPDDLEAGTYYIVVKTASTHSNVVLKNLRTAVSDFTVTIG